MNIWKILNSLRIIALQPFSFQNCGAWTSVPTDIITSSFNPEILR